MDKNTKILLIIVLILIAAISISLSYILTRQVQNLNNNSTNTNKTNKTTIIYNEAKKTTMTRKYITPQQAIDSVRKYGTSNTYYSAELITSDGAPYYLITAYQGNRSSPLYGEPIGGAKVDARSGRFISGMG